MYRCVFIIYNEYIAAANGTCFWLLFDSYFIRDKLRDLFIPATSRAPPTDKKFYGRNNFFYTCIFSFAFDLCYFFICDLPGCSLYFVSAKPDINNNLIFKTFKISKAKLCKLILRRLQC